MQTFLHRGTTRFEGPLILVVMACALTASPTLGQSVRANYQSKKRPSLLELITTSETIASNKNNKSDNVDAWIRKLSTLSASQRESLRSVLEKERTQFSAMARRDGARLPVAKEPQNVWVKNSTSLAVSIIAQGYHDENGQFIREKGTWEVPPGKSFYLASGKKKYTASEFQYQLQVGNLISPASDRVWVSYYMPARGTLLEITPAHIQKAHVVAKPKLDSSGNLLQNFKRLTKEIGDAKKSYDENVKPVVDAVRQHRRSNSVQVVLGRVELTAKKSNGKKWDTGNGRPDIVVRLKVKKFGGDSHSTGAAKDSYYHTFDVDAVRIKPGQELEVRVHDEDAFGGDDDAGSHRFTVTDEIIKRGQINLSFGRVDSLRLKFID